MHNEKLEIAAVACCCFALKAAACKCRAGDTRSRRGFRGPCGHGILGLPESPRLVESKLEETLINNLRGFLLWM